MYLIFQGFTVKIYFVQIWSISAVLLKTGKCRWFEITSYNNEPFSILFPSRLTWQKKVWKSSTTPSKSPTRTFSASSWLTWIRSHSLSTFTSLKWLDIAEPQTSSRPSVSRCLNVFNGPTPATFFVFSNMHEKLYMWKNAHPVYGFEPTTFRSWVSSHNH